MGKISVSEGIRRTKKIKGQLETHKERVLKAVSYRSDQEPAFSYKGSLEALEKAQKDLVTLTTAIAVSNATTKIQVTEESSITITEALRCMAELRGDLAWYGRMSEPYQDNLRKLAEEAKTEFTDSEETEMVEGMFGKQVSKPKRIKTEYKVICNLTIAAHAKKVEDLQEDFDRLNTMVEKSNHQTMIEI